MKNNIKQNPLLWILKSKTRIIILVMIIISAGYLIYKNKANSGQKTQYQTETAEKGNLVVIVSASGTVVAANSASISTQTSGVVKNIYVENGQLVSTGDPIAEVDLDMEGRQRTSAALAGYQNAKNSLDSAQTNLYALQSALFTNWDVYMETAQNSTYQNSDGTPKTDQRQLPEYMIKNVDWLSAEAKYKNQQNVILAAQTSLNSSWASYQQASPIVYAPISGTITGLSLQVGSVITAQTGSSGNSASQKIASIQTQANPIISVSLTEVDVPKVKIGNKATVTVDAIPDKTYTGKVISIDTIGTVSSGVTTYPAVIKLDTETEEIFSNMSAQANIITKIKNEVILVPNSAVKTQNGQSQVVIMKDGKATPVLVETGLSSSTLTEIISGIKEKEVVVTNTISSQQTTQNGQTRSPFSSFGGGGNFRIAR